jgi:hypothetical protein
MLKWVWRILSDEEGVWLHVIKEKYLHVRPILACAHRERCHFWRSIQAIKHDISHGASFTVGNGEGTHFWLDPWIGGQPLREVYPCIFAICAEPHCW